MRCCWPVSLVSFRGQSFSRHNLLTAGAQPDLVRWSVPPRAQPRALRPLSRQHVFLLLPQKKKGAGWRVAASLLTFLSYPPPKNVGCRRGGGWGAVCCGVLRGWTVRSRTGPLRPSSAS